MALIPNGNVAAPTVAAEFLVLQTLRN